VALEKNGKEKEDLLPRNNGAENADCSKSVFVLLNRNCGSRKLSQPQKGEAE
jgi:hypothetical protein